MASRSSRRSSPGAKQPFASTAIRLRKRWPTLRTSCAAQTALPALGAVRNQRGYVLHVSGHLRHRLRQVHRGRRSAVRFDWHQNGVHKFRRVPEDWQGNVPAISKFFHEHQCPSFLEYAEYPYATADEVKKALRVKSAMSNMLDQMQ